MKTEYIILAVFYGSVILFSLGLMFVLTSKTLHKKLKQRKIDKKRKHLRVIK